MSAQCETIGRQAAGAAMGVFERYLTVGVLLCILAGIGLGFWLPGPFQLIGGLELARVNIPVALLIWLMIIPMLLKIDFSALAGVREHWKGIGVTLPVSTRLPGQATVQMLNKFMISSRNSLVDLIAWLLLLVVG